MKRLFKLFTLVFVLLCATLLTGCAKDDQFQSIKNPITDAATILEIEAELIKAESEDVVIGLYDKANDIPR